MHTTKIILEDIKNLRDSKGKETLKQLIANQGQTIKYIYLDSEYEIMEGEKRLTRSEIFESVSGKIEILVESMFETIDRRAVSECLKRIIQIEDEIKNLEPRIENEKKIENLQEEKAKIAEYMRANVICKQRNKKIKNRFYQLKENVRQNIRKAMLELRGINEMSWKELKDRLEYSETGISYIEK